MAAFKKTNINLYSKPSSVSTPDNIYWKKLSAPVLVKEFGPIDYIDFSPIEPNYFAVTCSVRIQLYNPITKLVAKNISRFRENAYGGTFRSDGHLLCAGGEECNVKLFDVNSKNLLRLFKGHTGPVHRTFFTENKTQIASFSDDKTVRIWDIPTEKVVDQFSEHTDYIRAGAVSPVSSDIILSGGYDQKIYMYDRRSNTVVFSVDHGCPVESMIFLPTGGIFLSAGGTEIRVWDAFAGGRLLSRMSQHHKTITCLKIAQGGKRILSSSLDRHVKIYDVSTYKTVHTLDYPNAILSLATSKNDDTIVVGTVDGLISISRRETDEKPTKEERKMVSYKFISNTDVPSVDTVIYHTKKEIQAKHDAHLRAFRYTKALDCVLMPIHVRKTPEVTVTVMQELIRRKGLKKALSGRDSKSILQILKFLIKYISDYRFTRILLDVANAFLDVYEDVIHLQPADVGKMFLSLADHLRDEEQLNEQLCYLQGSLHMLLAAGNLSESVHGVEEPHNLVPSADARKNLVIHIT